MELAGQLEGQGDAVVAVGRVGGPFHYQRRQRHPGHAGQARSSLADGLVDEGRGCGDRRDDQGCVPSVTSRLSFCVPRCTVRVTRSPGWNWRSMSFNGCASSRLWPLTAVMTSLTFSPAFPAGDPASTACTSAPTGRLLAVAVVSSTMAKVTPITSPAEFNSGPPLLPGLMDASVWMAFRMVSSLPVDWFVILIDRCRALITPLVTLFCWPRGLPMAMASWPTSSAEELPNFRLGRLVALTLSTAMSSSGLVPTMLAS